MDRYGWDMIGISYRKRKNVMEVPHCYYSADTTTATITVTADTTTSITTTINNVGAIGSILRYQC